MTYTNFTEEFLTQVEDLTFDRKSVRTIAAELGCHYQKVQWARNHMGLNSFAIGQEVRRRNKEARELAKNTGHVMTPLSTYKGEQNG